MFEFIVILIIVFKFIFIVVFLFVGILVAEFKRFVGDRRCQLRRRLGRKRHKQRRRSSRFNVLFHFIFVFLLYRTPAQPKRLKHARKLRK